MAKKKILTDNGQEILPITHEDCVLDNNGVSIGSKIGNINELATDSRTDLVSAINDILEFNNETKEQLKEVLIANGVEIGEGESWESIIGKLNEKVSSGGGGLDIISATELPATGKENQICVIMDNPINMFTITSNSSIEIDNTTVLLYTKSKSSNYIYNINNINYSFNIYKIFYNGKTYPSYYWLNDTWKPLTYASLLLLQNRLHMNSDIHGGFKTNTTLKYTTTSGIYAYTSSSSQHNSTSYSYWNNKIDFSLYNELRIKVYSATPGTACEGKFACSNDKYTYSGSLTGGIINPDVNPEVLNYISFSCSENTPTEIVLDISDWTGENYLILELTLKNSVYVHVTDIELI